MLVAAVEVATFSVSGGVVVASARVELASLEEADVVAISTSVGVD